MDDYDHTEAGVFYSAVNVPGPGTDACDFSEVFSTGCQCRDAACYEACSCLKDFGRNYCPETGAFLKLGQDAPAFECHDACTCSRECSNRRVQFGPAKSLIVRHAGSKGLGLFTESSIAAGQFVCEYAGEVIGEEEASRRLAAQELEGRRNYILAVIERSADRVACKTIVDPAQIGNVGRYANHSCEPNLALHPVRVDAVVPHVALFALKDIPEGSELTFDYGQEESERDGDSQALRTRCLCASGRCRGFLPYDKTSIPSSK